MIDIALFHHLAKQKNVEIFTTSMQDIEYQLNKTKKPVTDPAIVVSKYYHNFLDVFSKEALNKISLHSKYNHNIELLRGSKNHR